MMKVLAAVIVPPHLSMSGGARAAEKLSAALSDHCDVTVANMMSGDVAGLGSESAKVRRVDARSSLPGPLPWPRLPPHFRTLFYRSAIPRIVASGGFDLVHLHNPMPALEMERVARACIANDVPYVVSTHGFNEVWNGRTIYGFGAAKRTVWKTLVQDPVARVVKRASGMFALSAADIPIIRAMGYSGDRLTIVPNGVDKPPPADSELDAQTLRKFAIPAERQAGQICCMFLANHTPNKGLPILLEAFAALERPYLLIVGGEKRQSVDYDRYIGRCRPGQRIVVTGRLQDCEIGTLFRRSDLFVFPTLADTFPLVVLEAMAHGVPVLASRVGGIPHQIDEHCGELVEPGNPEILRAAIEALARVPERLAEMGRKARERIDQRFSWSYAASQALDGYEGVLRGRKRSGSFAFAPERVWPV